MRLMQGFGPCVDSLLGLGCVAAHPFFVHVVSSSVFRVLRDTLFSPLFRPLLVAVKPLSALAGGASAG